MTWTSDSLPWNVNFSKPARPSGPFESLNYFPGNPILNRGKGSSSLPAQILRMFPGGPVLCRGRGSSSLARQLLKNLPGGPVLVPGVASSFANLKNTYRASAVITGGMGAMLANLKYFPGGPVLAGSPSPIIAAKLERFLGHP
jgi:hypothetical protein